MKKCDEILDETLRLTDRMAEIADLGDGAREDVGCGVLYGFLRDSAYKLKRMAEEEKKAHIRKAGADMRAKKRASAEGASRSATGARSGSARK